MGFGIGSWDMGVGRSRGSEFIQILKELTKYFKIKIQFKF